MGTVQYNLRPEYSSLSGWSIKTGYIFRNDIVVHLQVDDDVGTQLQRDKTAKQITCTYVILLVKYFYLSCHVFSSLKHL